MAVAVLVLCLFVALVVIVVQQRKYRRRQAVGDNSSSFSTTDLSQYRDDSSSSSRFPPSDGNLRSAGRRYAVNVTSQDTPSVAGESSLS